MIRHRSEAAWADQADIGGKDTTITTASAIGISGIVTTAGAAYPGENGRIAYSMNYADYEFADQSIATVEPDGTGFAKLTDGAFDSDPVWSPDGTKIAIVTGRNGMPQIWVMNADGTDQQAVTDNPEVPAMKPSWQPITRTDDTTTTTTTVPDSESTTTTVPDPGDTTVPDTTSSTTLAPAPTPVDDQATAATPVSATPAYTGSPHLGGTCRHVAPGRGHAAQSLHVAPLRAARRHPTHLRCELRPEAHVSRA